MKCYKRRDSMIERDKKFTCIYRAVQIRAISKHLMYLDYVI